MLTAIRATVNALRPRKPNPAELDTDSARTITLIRPDGTTEYHGPSINRCTHRVA